MLYIRFSKINENPIWTHVNKADDRICFPIGFDIGFLCIMFVIPVYRSTGNSSVPQISIPDTDTSIPGFKESTRGESASGQLRQHQCALSDGFPRVLMPSQVPGSNFTCGGRALGNSNVNIPGAHEASLQTRIEVI